MVKTRILLGLIAFVLALTSTLIYLTGLPSNWPTLAALMYISSFFLLPASLVMLTFSMFRVSTTPEGELAYDPGNPYWKLMKKCWKSEWTDNITLCKAFWLTVFSVGALMVTCLLIFLISFLVYVSLAKGLKPLEWVMMLKIIGGAILFFGPLFLAGYLQDTKQDKLRERILAIWALMFFVILPVPLIMLAKRASFQDAFLTYVIGIGLVILCAAGFFAALAGLAWLLSKTEDSILARYLAALKQQFCPTLVELKTE
jgi:hypothetical protein